LLIQLLTELGPHIIWSGGPADYETLSGGRLIDPGHGAMLARHDGLVAFDGGLRCFGLTTRRLPSLDAWNAATAWRSEYQSLADGLLFFAEDVFGNQFAGDGKGIVRFHAETGDREFMADSIEEWLRMVLSDPDEELGCWLLREWRRPGNVVEPHEHLCPKEPFVTGGPFDPANLYTSNRDASMRFKGDFAWQIRNVPQGGKIRLRTVR
jgi:hypothetical protein